MDQPKTPTSRLFVNTAVENKDEIEEKLERSYQYVQTLTAGLSDKDAHDALHNALLRENGYEEISFGLVVAILTEPQNAAKGYRDLTLITRDGFSLVVTHLTQLVLDRYLRFNDTVKSQLLWLLREMIKNAVTNVDNLCWHLMRHAAGGDVSQKNITLIESLLDVYVDYRSWLEKFPVLLASVVYTFLRLVEDHQSPYLATLRQKEVNFLVSIIRDHFGECLVIGRDLVRLLQNVARIPEFEQLWKDILLNPKSLNPQFTGVLQLLQTRTSRRFLQSRLTPEMERKLVFLTSQVRFGNHKRYQDWFQRQYLATPESQSLRCDMIRFIVGVIHPTNELLCSDIIPRWAVIGWLLTTCTSNVAVSNAKLALFYDWFFFDSEKDNIMNIEPAILVMHHSMRSHPAVSATLLDFLCRIIANFYPPLTDRVRNGIFSSLRQILDKRVLPSLLPLFDNAKLDRELRIMIRETFKEFCIQPAIESSSKMDVEAGNMQTNSTETTEVVRLNHHNHVLDNEPAFSDDEDDQPQIVVHPPEDDTDDDDIPLAKVRLKEKTQVEDIDSAVRTTLNRLQDEKDKTTRCNLVGTFVKNLIEADPDDVTLKAIAKLLCNCVQDDIKDEVCPKELTETTLLDSIKSPLFSLFKATAEATTTTGKDLLNRLLAEMYVYLPNIGYLLLYYLKVQVRTETRKDDQPLKTSVYKEFCSALEKKLDVCLYDDLSACHISDNRLMLWLVPDLYRDFKQQTIGNTQIMRVIVSTIDSSQLHDLICRIMQGTLIMLKNENIQPLLKVSLTWESIEQFFLWQLVQAHDVPLETITPLLPHLDCRRHSEAIAAMLLLMKRDKPTADIIKHLFSRDVRENGDRLVFTVIKYWCDEFMDKVGELISGLLSTRYPATSPNKRKRSGNKSLSSTVPSADQVLGHLNHIRSYSEKLDNLALYNVESVQRALQLAHSNSSDSQKKQFSELFALTEEEETSSTKAKGSGGGRGRKPGPKPKKTPKDVVSDSSEDSSEEEEIVKPKQAKKRKKVMSDSD